MAGGSVCALLRKLDEHIVQYIVFRPHRSAVRDALVTKSLEEDREGEKGSDRQHMNCGLLTQIQM